MKNVISKTWQLILATVLISSQVAAEPQQATCPQEFLQVSVHNEATMCQIFDASEHALSQSMSYFVALSPAQLISYYQSQHPQLSVHSSVNQRVLLTMQNNKTRVAISQDQQGAQVDILIL